MIKINVPQFITKTFVYLPIRDIRFTHCSPQRLATFVSSRLRIIELFPTKKENKAKITKVVKNANLFKARRNFLPMFGVGQFC